ncbi:PKD domain-containing protein [Nocardioides sp. J54]|uniref:PKD domain-containing protein n=1 Tax=Nocardioides sp. J54 TaxID=935866 RepID=UPI0012FA143D|nr:PKD domain-containing protein [Nocardioides sp. J54]
MKRWSMLLAVSLLAVVSPASADDSNAGTTDTGFWSDRIHDEQSTQSGAKASPVGEEPDSPAPIALGDGACAGAEVVEGEFLNATFCQQYREPGTPALTTGHVRRAFAELKLPAGEMVVQPPDGLTLVNFDTNFYTTTIEPITRTVRLLGRRVTLEATPSRYTWTFGDGQSLTTTDPGAPYPRLTITHNYLRTGTYRPTLATTYTGRFRVGNVPWRQIPGTVTIDGTGQPLRAIEAEPKLVSY